MNNKTKFLKFGIAVLLGAGVVGGLLYAQLNIPTDIDNAVMTIKQINITSDGQATTPKIVIDGSASDGNFLKVEWSILMGSITGSIGQINKVSGDKSSILWGVKNTINGDYSIIPWWSYNQVTGTDSYAFGNTVRVNGSQSYAIWKSLILNWNGSFVFSDGKPSNFTVSKDWVFIVKVTNGVGINTWVTTTGYDLTVAGSGIVYGNLKTNNMIAGAYYYGSITSEDDQYELKLSQWEGIGNIYYNSWYVGIGTNNPTAQLHVNGTTILQGLSTSTQTTALVVDANGNVGTRALNTVAFNGYTAPVTSVSGRTGAVVLTKTDVGLASVDNTADMAKPVSTATQTALNLKANLANPALTGIPTAPTASTWTSTTQIATTEFVKLQWYLTTATAPVTSVAGKAGVVLLTKADVGLANVDNTADMAKPVSTATQTALNLKANLASPDLTGIPTAPTASIATNTNQLATTKFVKDQWYLTIATEADPQVGTLTSGRWCTTDGTTVNCATVAPVTTESDPQVGTLTSGKMCTTNGTTVNCTTDIPVTPTNYVTTDTNQPVAWIKTFSNNTIFNGNVGIWTTSPQSKLHIFAPSPVLTLEGTVDDTTKINFIDDWSVVWELSVDRSSGLTKLWTTEPLSFWSANAEKMRILQNGNVGIWTASPATKLHVYWVDGSFPARISSPAGYIDIGPSNASWAHIYTDRPNFIFNAWVYIIGGKLSTYDTASLQLQTNGTTRIFADNTNGNVGIWTTTPAAKLHVAWSIWATSWIGAWCEWACESWGGYSLLYADGTIVATSSVTAAAFYYSSDITLKKDLTKITNPLEKIIALNGYNFTWKSNDKKDIWVVAQEVEKVFPEAVKADAKGLKSVEYGNLVAPIIEAIKELYTKYLDQQTQISELEQRIEILEKNIIK